MDRARILIADENELLARSLSWLLKEQGYDVTLAPRGSRLMEQLDACDPDLLMLDVLNDNGGAGDGGDGGDDAGYRLLREITADKRWRDMPVLVISTFSSDQAISRLLENGASDFVGKPFNVRELVARISAQLRSR
jgi:DNA-binding response OmpR family regulator